MCSLQRKKTLKLNKLMFVTSQNRNNSFDSITDQFASNLKRDVVPSEFCSRSCVLIRLAKAISVNVARDPDTKLPRVLSNTFKGNITLLRIKL